MYEPPHFRETRPEILHDPSFAEGLQRHCAGKSGLFAMIDQRRKAEAIIYIRLCTETFGLGAGKRRNALLQLLADRLAEGTHGQLQLHAFRDHI